MRCFSYRMIRSRVCVCTRAFLSLSPCVQDPWGWIDNRTGIYHAFTHDGNGVRSAGGHNWVGAGSDSRGPTLILCVYVQTSLTSHPHSECLLQAYPHRDPVNARWRSTGIAYTGQVCGLRMRNRCTKRNQGTLSSHRAYLQPRLTLKLTN